jgi:hypothetical protein
MKTSRHGQTRLRPRLACWKQHLGSAHSTTWARSARAAAISAAAKASLRVPGGEPSRQDHVIPTHGVPPWPRALVAQGCAVLAGASPACRPVVSGGAKQRKPGLRARPGARRARHGVQARRRTGARSRPPSSVAACRGTAAHATAAIKGSASTDRFINCSCVAKLKEAAPLERSPVRWCLGRERSQLRGGRPE